MTTSRSASKRSVSPKLVLLVDHDSDTRGMYAEFLRFDSWQVEEALDGREALATAISQLPDIIVTDTHLTGLSGYELCERLKLDPSTHEIPIIVVTADVFPADMLRAKNAGADLVLIKPCLPEALSDAAHQLLAEIEKTHRVGGVRRKTPAGSRSDR
jgi:CheY-like chemotaxis protein